MEENIHDDKLDDYVRKSFEEHEEDPSLDMWSRVEADLLPPTVIQSPRATYLRYGWKAVAAMVILALFSTLVCEHLYYEEKLRVLSATPAGEQNVSPKTKASEAPKHSVTQPNQNTQTIALSPPQATADPLPSDFRKTPTQTSEQSFKEGWSVSRTTTSNTEPTILEQKEEKWGTSLAKTQLPQQPRAEPTMSDLVAGINTSAFPSLQSIDLTTAAPALPKNLELTCLPTEIHWLERPGLIMLARPLIPKQPFREPSGWYVGLQTSLLANRERKRTPNARPSRPAFASKQENASVTTIWWLKTGKKLSTKVSLETGIGYQKTVRSASHTPELRFGDGIHLGMGTRRSFNYDLNTYEGTAEVNLRVELTNPGTQPPDNEPISLKINTEQRIEMLRIPLLAKYKFGTKRLHCNVKAGLMGNIALKNELDISTRVSQNPRFQPVAGSDGYTLQLNQKKFFLGYWLSAGAEFKLSQHLSLLFEPTLMGDFTRKDQYSHRLPQQFLSGLNVGANYYF